jgi:3-oxoadipate enol-lactonase
MSVQLAYTVAGPEDAPVLVLGNSLGTNIEMWEPQLPVLTQTFRVVRYDHRGHGASPVPAGEYRLEQLGEDVLAMLDALGVERVHLGGVSLGGMVAMWVAANAPERVDRLVPMCTSAKLGPPEMWVQRAETVRTQGTEAVAETIVGRWFTPAYAARLPEVVRWARGLIDGTSDGGYAGCCAAIQHMDLLPVLGTITAPTLVIGGELDPATPPEVHAKLIADGIPNARLEIIPDAAHLANVEQADAVNRLLLDFLGGTE